MPGWIDHALFAVLAAFFPIRAGTFGFRRLMAAALPDVPRVRRSLYHQAIALQWLLAGFTVALWMGARRPWGDLGLVPRWGLGALLVALALAAIGVFVAVQRREVLGSAKALASVRRQLEHVQRMIPRTPAELRSFFRLSVTAGICEELLYRGYLLWYLGHWMGPAPAITLAALVFGIGHAYQGPRGIALTAMMGALFAAIYVASGSLYLGMLAHAAFDMHSGHLGYVALTQREPEPESTDEGAAAEA